MAGSVDLYDVIHDAIEARLLDVHTAIPARVIRYRRDGMIDRGAGPVVDVSGAAQTVDAQIMVKSTVERADGSQLLEEIPPIPNVPVAWPRGGGGYYIHFPLRDWDPIQNEGDYVMLIFSEAAWAHFRVTGQLSPPGDLQRHSLSYPIAIPCIAPDADPLPDAPGDEMVIVAPPEQDVRVSRAGAGPVSDYVAIATKVAAQLDALKDAINGWTPVANDGGAALKTALSALFASWPGDMASSILKAEE
jgi:hypothetical protein